jgi:pimeloyl-ACP methyl ester carboxylesterase
MDLARRCDDGGLAAALEVDRGASETLQAADISSLFTSEPDRAALTNGYAAWLAASFRSGYASGVAGARDDWMAFVRDWGFKLADACQVTLWQGDCDDNVTPANAHWLADRIPGSELQMLPGEGHMSIGLRLPEILDDLLTRASAARDFHGHAVD